MNLKTTLATAIPLLLLAAAPVAVAHDDLNYDTGGHRYPSSHVEDGVAGTYNGPSSLYVGLVDPLSFAAASGLVPELALDPSSEMCGCGHPTTPPPEPEWYVSRGQIVCDAEMGGDGSSPQEPDEVWVDGNDYTPNSVPDGTWDDGGVGGACHTNYYGFAPYNTPGCDYDGARASNVAPLAAPWLGAACDWKTVEGGTPRADILATCAINGAQTGALPADAIACGLGFVGCATSPAACASDGVEVCGSDAVTDGANYGPGNTRVPYPSSASYGSDSFHGDGLDCLSADAMMIAYVYNSVVADPTGNPATLFPAVQGRIWQVD